MPTSGNGDTLPGYARWHGRLQKFDQILYSGAGCCRDSNIGIGLIDMTSGKSVNLR